jgi:hypothetical protein
MSITKADIIEAVQSQTNLTKNKSTDIIEFYQCESEDENRLKAVLLQGDLSQKYSRIFDREG